MSDDTHRAVREAAALEWLGRVRLNGAIKGDDGSRSTREAADYLDCSTATARRLLHKLHHDGLIDAFDGGNDNGGAPILWRSKVEPAGRAALAEAGKPD